MIDACAGCGGPVPLAARFCPACGASLSANTASPPRLVPRRTAPRRVARNRARPRGGILWREFLPALQLWLWLLGINCVLGLIGHASDITAPGWDLAATLATALVVAMSCFVDRAALLPVLRESGLGERTWWHLPAALLLLALFLELYFGVFAHFGIVTEPLTSPFVEHGWPVWSMFVLLSVAPAVCEELAFRGVIQHRLAAVMGPREAIAVQAAMFSVLHMLPLVFVSHFAFGVVLGVLRRTTGSLYPGMLVHALWNAWVVVQELNR